MHLLWKKIIFTGLILWIFFHYFFIIVNHSPMLVTGKIKSAAILYSYPFFHQNWSLFVPAPSHTKTFYLRYKTDSGWTPWKDTGSEAIAMYKKCSATGSDMMLLLITNSLHYVCAALPEKSGINLFPAKPEFRVFKHITNQLLKQKYAVQKNTPYELLIVDKGENTRVFYYTNQLIK